MHTGGGDDETNGGDALPQPSPDVRERHRAQLRAAIAAESVRSRRPGGTHPRRRGRRGIVIATSIGAACIAAAVAIAVLSGGGSGERSRVIAPGAPPNSPTSATTMKCGSVLPFKPTIPQGYGTAHAGAARESDTPVADGRLVITYPAATGSIEWRWPADSSALPPGGVIIPKSQNDITVKSGSPSTSTSRVTSQRSLFSVPGQSDACGVVELTVYDTNPSRVVATTEALLPHPASNH